MSLFRQLWFRLLFSAGLIALLAWRVDLEEALRSLIRGNYIYVVAAFPIYTLSKLVDAYRWRLMLRRVGSPPVLGLFGIYLMSNMANVLIPLRIGDFLRVLVPARRYHMPRAGLTATVFITESLLDGLAFVILLLIALAFLDIPNLPLGLVYGLIALVGGGMVAAVAVSRLRFREGWQEQGLFARLPRFIREAAARPVPDFVDGLALLGDVRLGAHAMLATMVSWLLETVVFLLFGLTFGLDLTFADYLVIMITANMIVAMPVAPSNLGPYEVAVAEVVALLGVDSALAGGYAIGSHLLNILWVGITGMAATWMLGLSLGDIFHPGEGAARREAEAET